MGLENRNVLQAVVDLLALCVVGHGASVALAVDWTVLLLIVGVSAGVHHDIVCGIHSHLVLLNDVISVL